ncbi:RNA-guided endonuclease InsQ/TnpB family protein [Thermomonospora amylolytica]|uniref:RNA-guided endonuclease InsQ/TnpB family protein n=1 Tax=Thermomonospora amylolytica TaxID=1411117 RepID=UPI000E6C0347|nr:RNA-guided endonuclease TnpB family protein [Thermomonospora amylolytica]
MSQIMKRAYKYRFYPTPEQAELLHRTFGCVRLVWNKALAERTRRYEDEGKNTSYAETAKWLTDWKRDPELEFLREVSNVPLQQALWQQQAAFNNFFAKRARYPRFKSKKKSRKSATFQNNAFSFRDGRLKLAKMTEPLDIRWSRPLPEGAVPSTATVSQDAAGRWFVSLLVEEVISPLAPSRGQVGIDAAWTELRWMLEYKTAWYGRELLVVDRFFPSSKLCSARECGYRHTEMPLDVRTWTCPGCGTVHDRDVNAAQNILAAGLAER